MLAELLVSLSTPPLPRWLGSHHGTAGAIKALMLLRGSRLWLQAESHGEGGLFTHSPQVLQAACLLRGNLLSTAQGAKAVASPGSGASPHPAGTHCNDSVCLITTVISESLVHGMCQGNALKK